MSVEEMWPIGPVESMGIIPIWEGGMHKTGEREEEEDEEGGNEASSNKDSTDESEGDESEPEPPLVVRRKVSFADAFGLDLVSVKEFDSAVVTPSKVTAAPPEETGELEEHFLSCLFSVPSSGEELAERLRQQMVELESVELLPGTTALRGIIRVVNLCYSKTVYVRISLDGWRSHFDLLAEYIPGSSDGVTDRFSFKLTLAPSVSKEGTRVEFCLRYETSVGTFWANNRDLNYVLFCHRRVKERRGKERKESSNHRSKRSCLKSHRKSSAEDTLILIPTPDTAATGGGEEPVIHTLDSSAEIHASVHQHQPLVDSQRRRRREDRLARVQDYFSQNQRNGDLEVKQEVKHEANQEANQEVNQEANQEVNQDVNQVVNQVVKQEVNQEVNQVVKQEANQEVNQEVEQEVNALKDIRKDAGLENLLPPQGGSTSRMIHLHHRTHSGETTPQILTYHQIPLLTLDWSGDKGQRSREAEENGEALRISSEDNKEDKMSVSDMWDVFLKGTDSKDNSSVPESVWLQSAALVGPSNNKGECQSRRDNSQEEVLVNTHTSRKGHTHTDPQSSNSHVTLATREHDSSGSQHATIPGYDNVVCHDTAKRSEAVCVTDTRQECSLALEASGDSRAKLNPNVGEGVRHEDEERSDRPGEDGKERVGGRRGGNRGGEEETVMSQGAQERPCAEETAEEGWVNDEPFGDKISLGERQGGMLPLGTKGEVTGTEHNATRDSVTFTEEIGEEIEEEGRVQVTCTSGEEGGAKRQGEAKVHRLNEPEDKVSPGWQETDDGGDLRTVQLQTEELRPCQSHTDEVSPPLSEVDMLSQPCTAVQTKRPLEEYLRTDQSAQHDSWDDVEISSVGNATSRPNQSNEDKCKGTLTHSQTKIEAHREKLRLGTGGERDRQAVERGGEENGSAENSEMVEVKEPMKVCESVQRECGDLSAEKQKEQKASMEKVEGSRQVENEKLSEGRKECFREVDRLEERKEEEELTDSGDLGEGVTEEVLHLQKAMEELDDGGTRGRSEEMCDTVYQKPQVNPISTTVETGTISDTAQTSPAPDPLIVEPKDLLFSLTPFISSSIPLSENSPVSLSPPIPSCQSSSILPSLSPSISPSIHPSVGISAMSIPPSIPPLLSPPRSLSVPASERAGHPTRSVLAWWGMVYSLGHVTRALVYALMVFLVTVLLCNFPACFAVYASWWWWDQSDKPEATVVEGIDHAARIEMSFRSEAE